MPSNSKFFFNWFIKLVMFFAPSLYFWCNASLICNVIFIIIEQIMKMIESSFPITIHVCVLVLQGLPWFDELWRSSKVAIIVNMLHDRNRNQCATKVAKLRTSSLFISAIIRINVVLFALVSTTTRATCAKEGRGLLWGLWTTSSLSR